MSVRFALHALAHIRPVQAMQIPWRNYDRIIRAMEPVGNVGELSRLSRSGVLSCDVQDDFPVVICDHAILRTMIQFLANRLLWRT